MHMKNEQVHDLDSKIKKMENLHVLICIVRQKGGMERPEL